MGDTIPAKLKGLQLAPFAKRAAQLEKFKPIVTYWLRFHMVQKIIAAGLHSADQKCTAYTTDLMETLEESKAQNPNEDALVDDLAASAYCEQFALQTFTKGDREMAENKATNNTVDTLLAASTFLEILATWRKDDPEITSKTKYAKYHALRILKAIKANEDPNLTNPVRETPQELASSPVLDPNDPEVQSINRSASQQPHVETAPNTDALPSPTLSAPKVSPPPNLPSAPTGYTHNSHNDVSPISQPTSSRHGSVGGGYFPRIDPPTFTAEDSAPSLPTAPSIDSEPATSGLGQSALPTNSQLSQAPQIPDPTSFYQNPASPPPISQPLQQPSQQHNSFPPPSPHNTYRSPPGVNPYAAPPPQASQPPQQPPVFQSTPSQPAQYSSHSPQPPPQSHQGFPPQQNPYAQPPASHPALSQGPFRDDEHSISEAQKHAKWAISALNFDDAATAVKELRIALKALGAN
ncbi:Vta1 like-domain-containing protein [Phaeosphaeriaceae sp. PMI808]|nr:Vta1 like-domain-containing protein [Phaeosphaeriaceae sp. PMI808]